MEKEQGASLWTRDFTRITIASVMSMIGGEAINLPLSLLVFDQTKSTFLSAFMIVCGMLPDILFSVIIAPVIDRSSKKKWIVGLDIVFLLTYAAMAFYTFRFPFHYAVYIAFTLVTSTLSVVYRLAYDAWYPDLVPAGMEQKGFSVSGMVMNSVTIVMAPVAAVLYRYLPIHQLFVFVAITIFIAILIEAQIKEDTLADQAEGQGGLSQYLDDLKAGFRYLKKEAGVRNIYAYMSTSMGAGEGMAILIRTFFQTAPWLGVTMYGIAMSVDTAARFFSGLFLYKKEVPVKQRFAVVRMVYLTINVLCAGMLFLPLPLLLVCEGLQGGLGNTSYTLRETAVKSYIPQEIRARLGAVFNMMICISGILFALIAGLLGEVMPLRGAVVLLCAVDILAMFFFIHLPGDRNRIVYEATRRNYDQEN